ncbi:GGDEF domain-containing protein [Marinobacterium jannaschii]|uniref:GGDEF domain-containing protein n=1 Tax=Marinobacterium jannaschii TaxID=64970 RepID=UPI000480B50E|nr:GGDEF domain-containing protein [Marinobacterium jannaschii]
MNFAENNSQAAEYLRQAVPLMVKHNIAPNPLNYALWYTYVSKRIPQLNSELDKTLKTYGTCPNRLSEELFREHLIRQEFDDTEKFQSNLVGIINDLHKHTEVTAENTRDYGDALAEGIEALQGEGQLPLESVLRSLASKTAEIGRSTLQFQQKINDAQAEIQQLKQELQRSRQDARIDPLTGLFNRRVFDSEITPLLDAAVPLSLVIVDIDHFKRFNDDYGHLMGDKVLQYVGKLLRDSCSEPNLPVRFGGEEFAILLQKATVAEAAEVAESLRQKIQAIRIKQKKSGDVISSITASFGIAEIKPQESRDQLIERADKALYQAKENGRNQVVIAD